MMPRVPRAPLGPVPFTFSFAALLTLLTCLLYMLVFILIFPLAPQAFPAVHAVAIALSFGNSFALAARRLARPLSASLALTPPPSIAWLVPFLLLPSLLLFSELDNVIDKLFPPPPLPPQPGLPAAAELTMGLIAFAVVQPAAFEAFFRGLCLGRLAILWNGPQAVFASSLLGWAFSSLTYAMLIQPTPGLLLSPSLQHFGEALLLGILRQSSGSLYPSLVLGSLFGVTRVLSEFRSFGIPGFDDMSAPHTPLTWLLPALALTALGLWLCHRMGRGDVEGEQPS